MKPLIHNGRQCIGIIFPYDAEMRDHVQKFDGIKWSRRHRCYYMPYSKDGVSLLFEHIRKKHWYVDYSQVNEGRVSHSSRFLEKGGKRIQRPRVIKLSEDTRGKIEQFRSWMEQKRYAINTVNTYVSMLEVFLSYYNKKNPDEIKKEDIESFSHDYILRRNYSATYQNQMINAIKLFYLKMQGIKHELEDLERPRGSRPLPKVIPKQDVKKMLGQIANLKHKTALSMIYGLGLRRSELINIALRDIDSRSRTVVIRNSKGSKDRVLPLPESLFKLIKAHYRANKPVKWLIEGNLSGEQYSVSSLQNIFKKNLSKVRDSSHFTLHCLRHSYATHLLDNGTDIRHIQELLGHKSTRTTEIYTHVSIKNLRNIKNPLDDFDI